MSSVEAEYPMTMKIVWDTSCPTQPIASLSIDILDDEMVDYFFYIKQCIIMKRAGKFFEMIEKKILRDILMNT